MGFLDETVGAAFIGCLFTAIFYGVTCLQAAQYFIRGPSEGRFTKGLVLAILSLDTMHMVLVSHFIYTLVVGDFGNAMKLGSTPWSLAASFVVSLSSDTIIRVFFARRTWYLSGQNVALVTFLIVFILLAFGATLSSTINVMTVSLETDLQRGPKQWLLDFTLASSGAADFCIAATLSFFFYTSQSAEYREGTNNILSALCKYTINTGLVATIWTVCCLITNIVMPKSYVLLVFYLPLSKVYVNAFLGSLNVRDSLRKKSKVTFYTPHLARGSTSIEFNHPETGQGTACRIVERKAISIRVDLETDISNSGSGFHPNSMRDLPVAPNLSDDALT